MMMGCMLKKHILHVSAAVNASIVWKPSQNGEPFRVQRWWKASENFPPNQLSLAAYDTSLLCIQRNFPLYDTLNSNYEHIRWH